MLSCTKIEFLGEAGEDGGGLRREFWRLLGDGLVNQVLTGTPCVIRRDAVGLKVSIHLMHMIICMTRVV